MNAFVVMTYRYPSDAESFEAFQRFLGWSRTELPGQVSAWRHMAKWSENVIEWCLTVVSESEAVREFDFAPGEPFRLDETQQLSFVLRRVERQVEVDAGLKKPQMVARYASKEAPWMSPDGVWRVGPCELCGLLGSHKTDCSADLNLT